MIVNDHELLRLGIAHLIRNHAGWELCGEASEAIVALELVREKAPDLAIVDLRLSRGDGLDLIRRIRVSAPACRMLVLSMQEEELFAERALRAGAHGYISKQEPLPCILSAIDNVLDGRIYLSAAMTDRLLTARTGTTTTSISSLEQLSDREMEVFERLGRGMTAKEIAMEMRLSIKTIEYHRQNIKEKLGLSGSTAVVRRATAHVLGQSGVQQD